MRHKHNLAAKGADFKTWQRRMCNKILCLALGLSGGLQPSSELNRSFGFVGRREPCLQQRVGLSEGLRLRFAPLTERMAFELPEPVLPRPICLDWYRFSPPP